MRIRLIAIILALAASSAAAVPTSVPRDPPAPPTGFGRLFGEDVQFTLSCAVTATTPTSATVGFSSTYPHRSASYIDGSGTWSAWANLAAGVTDYDCSGSCLHSTAQVRIRGCDTAACTGVVEECTATIGVPVNGPPDLVWSGVETLSVGALGCVQTDAAEVVVRLRYAGAHPAAGFPTVAGVTAVERTAERAIDGAAFVRTYTVAPGWTPGDEAVEQWSFVVALDASGSRQSAARVELREYCLNPPQASVVSSGGTLAPINSGDAFVSGSELELATGNAPAIYTLTGHQLSHDGTVEPFGRVTIAVVSSDTQHTWFESATGRDALTYRSPDFELTAQALACENDLALASWWLDPSSDVALPLGTAWVTGPVVRTDACPGIGADPTSAGPNTQSDSEIRVNSGTAVTGWPTEVRAKAPSGQVNDFYYWFGTGWDTTTTTWYFSAERPASLACPAGQRLGAGGACEACPTYQQCSGGSLATTDWCNAGTPPADDRMVSHVTCVGTTDTTVSSCVESTDPDPADAPCPVCPAGQREVAGVCQACPTYQTCDGSGNLVSNSWCNAGSPPPDASIVSYQSCSGTTTVTEQACLDPGDARPVDDPCPVPTCNANERLVGNVCSPCPTYDACTGTQGSIVSRTYCGNGRPPRDAREESLWACVGGDTEIVDYCIGEGGLAASPGHVACPGDDCHTFYGCNRHSSSNLSYISFEEYIFCGGYFNPPDYPRILTRFYCPMGATVESVTYYCDGYNGVPSYDIRPDSMCDDSADCVDYEACTWPASSGDPGSNMTRTRQYCGAGTPPADAYVITRQVCEEGVTEDWTFCIGDRGAVEDPGNNPCDGTPVNTCADYQACSAATSTGSTSLLVNRQHCAATSLPASAQETTRRSCSGGTETTTRYCVGTGGLSSWASVPSDSPCQAQACVDYKTCSSASSSNTSANLLLDRQYCGTGSAPADAYQVTRQACDGGTTEDRTFCVGENGESTDPGNNPCSNSGNTCTDYKACSSTSSSTVSANLLVDRQYCGTGSAPATAYQVTRQVCNSGVTDDWTFCVGENGESADPGNNTCSTDCQPSGTRPCVTGTTHVWSTTSCSYVVSVAGPSTRLCDPPGTTWSWDCATEAWTDSETDASCPVISDTGYVNDRWSFADCRFQTSATKAKPSLAACESAAWTVTDAQAGNCSWVTTGAPAAPTGCPGEGQAWGSLNTNTCSYDTVAAADCPAGEEAVGWMVSTCKWDCVVTRKPPTDLATFSNFSITEECGVDGEGIAVCGVTLAFDGTIIGDDLNNPSWSGGTVIGNWATATGSTDIATDVLPLVSFSVTQLSGQSSVGGQMTCTAPGIGGGAGCTHTGGGWIGNQEGTPGGSWRITIADSGTGDTLASGTIALRGGRAAVSN